MERTVSDPIPTRIRPVWLLDGVVITIPVVAVLGVYGIPSATKRGMVFVYRDPTLLGAYTANFVHFSIPHLLANLLGYLLVGVTAYGACLLARRRQSFLTAFVGFILLYPLGLSYANVVLGRSGIGYGFSGVVMSFVGFLPLALGWLIRQQYRSGAPIGLARLLFLSGLVVISFRAGSGPDWLPIAQVATGVAFASVLVTLVRSRDRIQTLAEPGLQPTQLLIVLGVILVIGLTYGAVSPANQASRVPNLRVHLIGYVMGFIGPWFVSVVYSR